MLNNGFKAMGEIDLVSAEIGGDLNCREGEFKAPGNTAILAHSAMVKGDIELSGNFCVEGQIDLVDAHVGKNLLCSEGVIDHPKAYAFCADGIIVDGVASFHDGFRAFGGVSLMDAKFGRSLACISSHLTAEWCGKDGGEGRAFVLETSRVEDAFIWRSMKTKGQIILAHSKVGALSDDQTSWPGKGNLDLNGFEYDELVLKASTDADVRIDWLKRQKSFVPQPYEQLVHVLKRMGHDRDAREVAIAKQNELRESDLLEFWGKLWIAFLGVTVSYGYKPWRALLWAAGIYVLGVGIFDAGYSFDYIGPSDPRVYLSPSFIESSGTALPLQYPQFKALMYSLDVLLPIVDLHQESYWIPNTRKGWGWVIWCYMWFEIIAGWVLTSVAVAALTNLIKKD